MSLDTLLHKGEQIYFEKYKESLEKYYLGSYVVIDVDTEKHIIHTDKLKAFLLARESFGEEKLFFVAQIGEIHEPTVNFRENDSLSWAV